MDGTGRVEYCQFNTSEEDCNTTTSASSANTTLTGLQSFTWYRLTLNFTNCSGTFSTQPVMASTGPLSPFEYGIRLEYDLQKEMLKVLKSSENLIVPNEICFKPVETTDCSRTKEDQCVPAGSTLHKVVPLNGFVGVVSYGRQTCSTPSVIHALKPMAVTDWTKISFATVVVGLSIVLIVLVCVIVVMKKKHRKQSNPTRSSEKTSVNDYVATLKLAAVSTPSNYYSM
ncbi:uncharacterized protein [Diadema antillarum]|uniref:uncharacterized protein n=1 Tax=Diadema antillarum TaxID=105358 RepID=UPI003A8548D2